MRTAILPYVVERWPRAQDVVGPVPRTSADPCQDMVESVCKHQRPTLLLLHPQQHHHPSSYFSTHSFVRWLAI